MVHLGPAPWMQEMRAFSSIAPFCPGTLNLAGGLEPVHVKAAEVSPEFFRTLGAQPALGRVLNADDHVRGDAYAVVLGDGVWRRMFGGDRGVIGRTVQINGRPTHVVGVMPRGFDFPDASEVYVPATILETPFLGAPTAMYIARLRPEVTTAQAQAEGVTAWRQHEPRRSLDIPFFRFENQLSCSLSQSHATPRERNTPAASSTARRPRL